MSFAMSLGWAVWAVPAGTDWLQCWAADVPHAGGCPQARALHDTRLGQASPRVQTHGTHYAQLASENLAPWLDALDSIIWDFFVFFLKFKMSCQRLCCVQGTRVKWKLCFRAPRPEVPLFLLGRELAVPSCLLPSQELARLQLVPVAAALLGRSSRGNQGVRGATGSSYRSIFLQPVVVASGEAVCGSWCHGAPGSVAPHPVEYTHRWFVQELGNTLTLETSVVTTGNCLVSNKYFKCYGLESFIF